MKKQKLILFLSIFLWMRVVGQTPHKQRLDSVVYWIENDKNLKWILQTEVSYQYNEQGKVIEQRWIRRKRVSARPFMFPRIKWAVF